MATDDTVVVIHDCGDDTCPRFGQQIYKGVSYVLITEEPGKPPFIQSSGIPDKAAQLLGVATAMLPSMERARYEIEDDEEPDEDDKSEKPN